VRWLRIPLPRPIRSHGRTIRHRRRLDSHPPAARLAWTRPASQPDTTRARARGSRRVLLAQQAAGEAKHPDGRFPPHPRDGRLGGGFPFKKTAEARDGAAAARPGSDGPARAHRALASAPTPPLSPLSLRLVYLLLTRRCGCLPAAVLLLLPRICPPRPTPAAPPLSRSLAAHPHEIGIARCCRRPPPWRHLCSGSPSLSLSLISRGGDLTRSLMASSRCARACRGSPSRWP
jgi:hypothetical protein